MPNTGRGRPARAASRRRSRARPGRRGRWPGRRRRGRASSSSALVVHGCSSTRRAALDEVAHDRALDAGVDRGDARAAPSPTTVSSAGRVTSRARSRPAIGGSAAISSRASRSAIAPGKTPPRIAPALADVAHERARVDAGDRRHAAVASASPASPARRAGASSRLTAGAHDRRAGVDAVGLHRLRARRRSCRCAGR